MFVVMVGDAITCGDEVALVALYFSVEGQDAGVAAQTTETQIREVFDDAIVAGSGIVILENCIRVGHSALVILQNGENRCIYGHAARTTSPLVMMDGLVVFRVTKERSCYVMLIQCLFVNFINMYGAKAMYLEDARFFVEEGVKYGCPTRVDVCVMDCHSEHAMMELEDVLWRWKAFWPFIFRDLVKEGTVVAEVTAGWRGGSSFAPVSDHRLEVVQRHVLIGKVGTLSGKMSE